MKKLMVVVAVVLAVQAGLSSVRLAGPFADGAVLQRGMKVPVWGWAEPGEDVSVSFAGQTKTARADETGAWRVDLDPLEASCEGRDLVVSSNQTISKNRTVAASATGAVIAGPQVNASRGGRDGTGACNCLNQTILHDILVGEVWFVSGQSNAELQLCGGPHGGDRNGHAVAQKTRLPLVRFCRMPRGVSETPQTMLKSSVMWRKFLPENLLAMPNFSAMGAYYGIELYHALQIPIGLVGAYWGGTCIDGWVPREGHATRPELKDISDWKVSMTWDGKHPKSLWPHNRVQDQPGVIWNAMVSPWCPYAIRGVIWYQGEANSRQPERYCSQLHALYNGWSQKFGNPNLKLYYVQLAPWGKDSIPKIQIAQAQFEREQPNAAMAVINDIGNLTDIHPNEKGTVGLRLALHALKRDYGFTDIQDNSPTVKEWKVEGDTFVLSFDNAKWLYQYNPDFSLTTRFELAGADGVFKPAEILNFVKGEQKKRPRGRIDGLEIRLRAEGVEKPVKLRYLHSHPWTGNIYNEADLPLGAFQIGE